MDHRGDELELLGHTLGELFDLLVPPAFYPEADEPLLEGLLGLRGAHSLELGEIHRLFTHLHFAIKATLLWHISYFLHIPLGDALPLEEHLPGGWDGNSVDDADEGCFARSIRSEKAENLAFGNLETYIVQRHLLSEALADIFDFDD